DATVTAVWARAHLRDLEDRYASLPYGTGGEELEKRIVAASLRFGVLCRFTAWVAVDERVVAEGGPVHRVVQPVELPAGWAMPMAAPMAASMTMAGYAAPAAAPMTRGRSLGFRPRQTGGRMDYGPMAKAVGAADGFALAEEKEAAAPAIYAVAARE